MLLDFLDVAPHHVSIWRHYDDGKRNVSLGIFVLGDTSVLDEDLNFIFNLKKLAEDGGTETVRHGNILRS